MNKKKLQNLCLFSGGGGLSYGLEESGEFETIAFCELNKFRQKILHKNNPKKYIFENINHLEYKDGALYYRGKSYIKGRIDAISGGFPCQPFSSAGKKKGKEDDRDLWPEMFRLISEALPTWVIGENVADFIDMAFDRTKIDLESKGYTVRAFVLPACSVGAQHRRYRVFIIAHLDKDGRETQRISGRTKTENAFNKSLGIEKSIANSLQEGRAKESPRAEEENADWDWESHWGAATLSTFGNWGSDKPGVGRAIHGVSPKLDAAAERIRRERVELLGDSVVPALVEIVGRAIGEFNRWLRHE